MKQKYKLIGGPHDGLLADEPIIIVSPGDVPCLYFPDGSVYAMVEHRGVFGLHYGGNRTRQELIQGKTSATN